MPDEEDIINQLLATDRLLKALTSLLVVEQPERLSQLRRIFEIAAEMESPIAKMPAGAWREITRQLDIIEASFGPDLH